MKRSVALLLIAVAVLAGCVHTKNIIGSVFNPIVGTWVSSSMGVDTRITFNADKTCTQTVTVLGVGTTKNGTWDSNETVITRTWSDHAVDYHYYTFNSDTTEMTQSMSAEGLATIYKKV